MFELFKKKINLTQQKIKPVVLIILDGWGVGPAGTGNAMSQAKIPYFQSLLKDYPNGQLLASGESVGLPAEEVGNTEVGHLNLGAGRIILQDLVKINKSIETGMFFENDAFAKAIEHVKQGNMHIMGLIGRAGVHSSLNHLYSLLELCKRSKLNNVYLHLFTDGRDSPPQDAINLIKEIELKLKVIGVGKIASISGRFFSMDRDLHWDRTKAVYDALVNVLSQFIYNTPEEAIMAAYKRGETDEFIKPSLIANQQSPVAISDNDSCIFFNYRIDRPRQLTMAFTIPTFEGLKSFQFGKDPEKGGRPVGNVAFEDTFTREKIAKNLFFVSMTQYDPSIPVSAVAFPPETIKETLTEVLSSAGLWQLHLSESEKERFVTYYFDGQKESDLKGEDVLIIPSPRVAAYDKKPEMSLPSVTKAFLDALSQDKYAFFVINIANADMVSHTGNIKAAISAIEYIDKYLKVMVDNILQAGGTAIITADHGNAEELLSYQSNSFYFTSSEGKQNTEHSKSPVPIIFVKKEFQGKPRILPRGALKDVAPTILHLMGIKSPPEMTGINLLE